MEQLRTPLAEAIETIRRAGSADGEGSYAFAVGSLDFLIERMCRIAGHDDLAELAAENRRQWVERVRTIDADDEPPEPDGECFRGGEADGYAREQMASYQRLK